MKIKKDEENLRLNVFLLLLTLIVSNVAVLSTFSVLEYQVICSAFTYPFVFYFANKILKTIDCKKFIDILIGVVFIQLIVFYLMNGEVLVSNFGSVIAFFITQLINMYLFTKIKRTKDTLFSQIFLVYVGILIFDALLFSLFFSTTPDLGLFYGIIIKIMVGLVISILEYINIKH